MIAFLAAVATWSQLQSCERVVAQLERLQHVQEAKALPMPQGADHKAAERALTAYRAGVRAKDVAGLCGRYVVGEEE